MTNFLDKCKIIKEYWGRCPTNWEGRADGNPLKMHVFQDCDPWEEVSPKMTGPMNIVSYVWEQHRFGKKPMWRVTGTYQGRALVVAWGPL